MRYRAMGTDMRHRAMGRGGPMVSAIGFGAWGIGGAVDGGLSYGSTNDAVSLAALHHAFDNGVNFFDTAPLYGLGHSETLIGKAFRHRRDQVFIATKAGYGDFVSGADFSADGLRRSVEGSLRRLGTDYVDLLQLHDPAADLLHTHPEVAATLQSLRDQGKVRMLGASVKAPADGLALAGSPLIGAIQCNFSMMDLRALECGLLHHAETKGIAIIARTPLCFGFLTATLSGDEDFAAGDHRRRWPRQQLRAWADGARHLMAAADADTDHATTALRFTLSFPSVAVTIPGMLTSEQVDSNLTAGRQPPLPPDAIDRVIACNRAHDGFKVTAP